MTLRRALIIAGRRTVIGRVGGLHARRKIEQLAAPVVRTVLEDGGLQADNVDEIIMGNAIGAGGNPARLIGLAAGLPDTVPGLTIDRQCASGLDAIVTAARMIETGAAEAVIAGGAESASTAPWRVAKPSNLFADIPRFFEQAAFATPEHGDPGMIEAAENVARQQAISRERQDAFALASHDRAIQAAISGAINDEIVPLGSVNAERTDEGPRAGLHASLLARMQPLTGPEGTVTAGNSCQINDAAAALLLVSPELHQKLGAPPALEFLGAASGGAPPHLLGLAAIPAAKKLARKLGGTFAEPTIVELNEAFAAQALATIDALALDPERVNSMGGALALGHPYGASGALLVLRLFTQLLRNPAKKETRMGLALIAAAGGVGLAAGFAARAY